MIRSSPRPLSNSDSNYLYWAYTSCCTSNDTSSLNINFGGPEPVSIEKRWFAVYCDQPRLEHVKDVKARSPIIALWQALELPVKSEYHVAELIGEAIHHPTSPSAMSGVCVEAREEWFPGKEQALIKVADPDSGRLGLFYAQSISKAEHRLQLADREPPAYPLTKISSECSTSSPIWEHEVVDHTSRSIIVQLPTNHPLYQLAQTPQEPLPMLDDQRLKELGYVDYETTKPRLNS